VTPFETLPQPQQSFLKTFLPRVQPYCRSVYLTGSWAVGEGNARSDLDLIIVTKNRKRRLKVEAIVHDFSSLRNQLRFAVDSRVYADEELTRALASMDHFMLWVCFRIGKPLWGNDIRVRLNTEYVRQAMTHWLERMNEVDLLLASESQFTACGYTLYAALLWFYYVERYLLLDGQPLLTKQKLLQHHFGKQLTVVRKCYYRVAKMVGGKKTISDCARVRIREAHRVSSSNYSAFLPCYESVLAYVEDIRVLIQRRLEQ